MFFTGISLVLSLNSVANVSLDWFGAKERVIFTSLTTMLAYGSISIGFFLPNVWIDTKNKDEEIAK